MTSGQQYNPRSLAVLLTVAGQAALAVPHGQLLWEHGDVHRVLKTNMGCSESKTRMQPYLDLVPSLGGL